jgi:hypothetical protein
VENSANDRAADRAEEQAADYTPGYIPHKSDSSAARILTSMINPDFLTARARAFELPFGKTAMMLPAA